MKRSSLKNITILAVSAATITLVITACNKSFLDKTPLGSFNIDQLTNKAGVDGLLTGAYHMLSGEGGQAGNSYGSGASNWPFGMVAGGDSYKGSTPSDQGTEAVPLATWAYNTNNTYLTDKWRVLYDGAQRANDVLRVMPKVTDMTDAAKTVMIAEARFLRGYYHFEAKKFWNNVPYVDETISTASGTHATNVDQSGNYVDIWPKIEADFQFAIDNLPAVQSSVGRVNKSAAIAFLGKALLYEHKYALAKAQFDKIIPAAYGGTGNGQTANGKEYKLVNYEDNFNAATDNSAESIFAFQASVNDGSGTNGNYGDCLNFPNGSGPGGCCGFNNPSMSLANSYKTDANGLPLFDTYNDGASVSDSGNLYTGTLDPRIDWVMGRPGINFFDWGPTPKNSWIRDPGSNGFFSPKKNTYAKSQQGIYSSTETSFWGPTQITANNVNLIRFADVLLWAAECEIEVGTAAKALEYVNYVRARAKDPTGWVYKSDDYDANVGKYKTQTTKADNYSINLYPANAFSDKTYALKAIRFERKLELAMEGQRFFDLSRWDNNTGTVMAPELNAYAAKEKLRPTLFAINKDAVFTPLKNEYFPIPQAQIDAENASGTVYLKQNKGY